MSVLRRALCASAALALTFTSVAAQATPQTVERAGAGTAEAEELSTTLWIAGVIVFGLLIWGIIEITDDDDEELPQSP